MATIRQRRAGANPPPRTIDAQAERIYTEEDYAAPESTDAIADEWANTIPAYAAGWTGEEFLPDDDEQPDPPELLEEGEWHTEDFVPYADEGSYVPLFEEQADFDDDLDPLSDELLTEEEQAELRRSHWQLIAGLADFAGVILGTAAILLLVTLLVSLLNWLINDMSQSFILLQKNM